MEDFVTWVDTSKLKRTIMQYNDEVRFNLSYVHSSLTISISWTILSFCKNIKESPALLKIIQLYHEPPYKQCVLVTAQNRSMAHL